VVAEIVKLDGKAIAVQGDVSKSADVKRIFAEAKKAFGDLDILVNKAGGSVVNVSSVISKSPIANSVVYSATKGAIDTITEALSKELAGRNIRVNSVAPGGTETEGTHTAGIIGGEFEKMMIASTPLGCLGQPRDIAKVAVFLASEQASWLTGVTISASGGQK
jgi:3-oxoacyl-[acyl-carrier protein] reductase